MRNAAVRFVLPTAALTVLTAAHASTQVVGEAYDIILRHGTVLDGTGLPRFSADVAIVNGRIARIGDLASARAATDLDVAGLCVTPGSINIHSHATPEGGGREAMLLRFKNPADRVRIIAESEDGGYRFESALPAGAVVVSKFTR
jgi:imidazolonepropionase-like amidohydrolase